MLAAISATARADLSTAFDATCRVSVPDGIGTGCVFRDTGSALHVLTNAHVVGNAQAAAVEFFLHGAQSVKLPGRVVFRRLVDSASIDVAIVEVDRARFGGRLPGIVPLAKPGSVEYAGEIFSVGCPRGGWPTAWKGRIIRNESSTIMFRPAPQGGRSGSAIFSADGSQIIALLAWRNDAAQAGRAQTIETLAAAFGGSAGPGPSRPAPPSSGGWTRCKEPGLLTGRLVDIIRPGESGYCPPGYWCPKPQPYQQPQPYGGGYYGGDYLQPRPQPSPEPYEPSPGTGDRYDPWGGQFADKPPQGNVPPVATVDLGPINDQLKKHEAAILATSKSVDELHQRLNETHAATLNATDAVKAQRASVEAVGKRTDETAKALEHTHAAIKTTIIDLAGKLDARIDLTAGDAREQAVEAAREEIADRTPTWIGWLTAAGLTALGVGGVPAAIGVFLAKRAATKVVSRRRKAAAREQRSRPAADSVGGREAAPAGVVTCTCPPPSPVPVVVQCPRPTETAQRIVVQQSAPSPVKETIERNKNHYVPVADTSTDAAWAEALARVAKAYPGSEAYMQRVERIKDLILAGDEQPRV